VLYELDMRAWLKLVGTVDWQLDEAWTAGRGDLLREVRFSEAHPPDPISRGDRLVYHAVGDQRIVAIVEVLDDDPTVDSHPVDWEKRWPLIVRVRPLLRVSRVSQAPATSVLGSVPDRAHQSFVPLTDEQLTLAEKNLQSSGAR
jgi:hypothetical protein